mmetsp:Transcript_22061/g.28553  ORF Transcript_22061/g.28553 Transcript_22061/m.28553 type:complete len:249 (-) Transcript_22061:72-818(-)
MQLHHHSTLKFVGGSEASIFGSPGFRQERHSHELFQMTQFTLGMFLLHGFQNGLVEFRRILDFFNFRISAAKSIVFGPFLGHRLIQLQKSNGSIHFTVTVAANTTSDGINEFTIAIGHFHLFERNVFTSEQFDQVLFTIHNTNTSITHKLSNITGMEPSIFLVNFISLVLHQVVTGRNVDSPHQNFTTSKDGISLDITCIGVKISQTSLVANVGGRFQLDFAGWNGLTGNSSASIIGSLNAKTSTCFR